MWTALFFTEFVSMAMPNHQPQTVVATCGYNPTRHH